MVNRLSFLCVTLALLFWCGLSAVPVSAQTTATAQTPPAAQQKSASPVSPESEDLAITAHVTARSLRFDVVPNPTVEFPGHPQRETVWKAERQNLPRPVQPGVTYRDIGIRLRITSVFADIDRIVAEALGEVPASEDTPPKENVQTPAPSPPSPSTSQPAGARPRRAKP